MSPGVATGGAADVVRAVAAYGLPTAAVLPADPLPETEFDLVLSSCTAERLLGLLGEAVGAGRFPVTEPQWARLEAMLLSWSLHELRVEQAVLRGVAALTESGIASRVLKGVALCRTAYDEVEHRAFGDVDLLVPSGRVHDAVAVLTAALDAERAQPELRPGFDERFGKEVLLKYGPDRAFEFDLHRVFVDGAFGLTIVTDDLFAPPLRFPLAGYELEALPMPQRLLSTCYAASLGDWPPRLISLRDVVQLVLREQPNLVDLLMMARAWRCEVVVADAVETAWDTLQVEASSPIVTWARNHTPDRAAEQLLESHHGVARSFTRHVTALRVLPTMRDRIAYARAIAFPQRSYLEARGLSERSHVRRAIGRIRAGRR
jgi:hypothetical protein